MPFEPAALEALRDALGVDGLLTRPSDCAVFECDALTLHRHRPDAVALPSTVDQVQRVMRICHEHQVPVVARGAGTGLSGGALPVPNALLLVLTRLSRILEVDPRRRTARVEPGVTNAAVSAAAAPFGLFYAPDPSSQVACTIGGNIAENSGGAHCLKYGLTTQNVLTATIVTAQGERLTLGSVAGDAPGDNLLSVLIGSEGMLGVVVEATLRLVPVPARIELVVAAFDSVERCAGAVASIISAGVIPAALEMMDQIAIAASENYSHCGYPVTAAALLLCELDGDAEDVADQRTAVIAILKAAGATQQFIAADATERLRLWAGRKNAFPAVGQLAPDYYCMDGSIPRAALADVLARIAALAAAAGLRVANVFHAGDGNLHPLILFDGASPEELRRAERLGASILELCVEVGGSVTGEHGVGVEKLDPMCRQFGAVELELFHAVKRAFDPDGRLNPGKAVPTLARCADYGALRVQGGRLPHAHLPRF